MNDQTREALRLLDIAVWGFEGEPRRCSRCGRDEGDDHSPTCPMPAQVLEPLRRLHGVAVTREQRWESYVQSQIEQIKKAAVG